MLIIVVCAAGLYLILSWLLITPMERIADGMRRFSRGERETRLAVAEKSEAGGASGFSQCSRFHRFLAGGVGLRVAGAVILFGLPALYVRRFVDPTLDTLFRAIALVSFIYALYVPAGSVYAARWAHVKKYVCQKCLHEWLPSAEVAP